MTTFQPTKWGIPDLGLGLGLRAVHVDYILEHKPPAQFFEIITENYLGVGGRLKAILKEIAAHYPILVHGVSMNIGSTDPLNLQYFHQLKELLDMLEVPFCSDHLCWTGVLSKNSHDLLPVPLTEEVLKHVVGRIKQVQDLLERPIALENPSSYLEFQCSQMPEVEFMVRMAEDADCGILLDINNIYVSGFNHNFDPWDYIEQIPVERILYHHVAGHSHMGTHILDTHTGHVIEDVWKLYARVHQRTGGRATMVEWDDDIPEFPVVFAEVQAAADYRNLAERCAGAEEIRQAQIEVASV